MPEVIGLQLCMQTKENPAQAGFSLRLRTGIDGNFFGVSPEFIQFIIISFLLPKYMQDNGAIIQDNPLVLPYTVSSQRRQSFFFQHHLFNIVSNTLNLNGTSAVTNDEIICNDGQITHI